MDLSLRLMLLSIAISLSFFFVASSKWTRQCQDLGGRRESEKLIKKRERLEGGDEITRETR